MSDVPTRLQADNDLALVILSDGLSAAEIESMIGLAPDRSWGIGEPIGRSGRAKQPYSGWRIDVVGGERTPEARVSELLDRIRPVEERIGALGSDRRIHSVALWIGARGGRFAMELPLSRLSEIARLGATLKVNAYDLGASDEPSPGDTNGFQPESADS